MPGLQKLYPSSKDFNDIRSTPISAINSALATSVTTDGLQDINQLLREQQQTISAMNTNMYNLSNVVVNGIDMGNDSDTASTGTTGTGVDSLNSIREFAQNFRKGGHK